MQRSNHLDSLKRTIVLFTLFVGGLGVYEIVAQCEKWTFGFDSNNATKFLSTFPTNCDNSYIVNGSPYLTCYWSDHTSACKAQIQVENWAHTANTMWTFISDTQSTGDPNKYICKYKVYGVTSVFVDRFVDLEPVYFQPYQSHCDIPVEGPYRDCSAKGYDVNSQRGAEFSKSRQKPKILQMNAANNNGKLKSDLAGYTYPKPKNGECIKRKDPNDPNLCVEPDTFTKLRGLLTSPEIHHVIPRNDRQGCPCGKNSMKNAVVISKQLNIHFLNYKRPTDEITRVNKSKPFPCS